MENNWKTIFVIYSAVGIAKGEYKYKNAEINIDYLGSIRSLNVEVYTDNVERFRVMTIKLAMSDEKIDEVYLKSRQIAYEYLARISLLGYCAAEIIRHIITTCEYCEMGNHFEVLSTDILHVQNYKVEIQPNDFEGIYVSEKNDEYLEVSIGFLRRSLTTNSLEEKIINLYACLERIAANECIDYKIESCKNCGFSATTELRLTKKFIKRLLKERGVDNKSINDFADRDRNKIAHGAGLRDGQFYRDLKDTILKIQHAVLEIIKIRTNANLVNSRTTVVEDPRVVYNFRIRNDLNYELIDNGNSASIIMSTMAGISKVVDSSEKAEANGEFKFGVSYGKENLHLKNSDFQSEFFPKLKNTSLAGIKYSYISQNPKDYKYPFKIYRL